MKKIIAKINKNKCWFFEEINEIDKLLARLIKKGKTEREPKLIKSEIKMEKLQPMPQKYNG